MENQIPSQNTLLRCVKQSFSFLLPEQYSGVSSWPALLQARLTLLLRPRVARVRLALLAGLHAIETSKRILAGMIVVLIVAPLSGVTYLLFNDTLEDPAWFMLNYYQLFLQLGPYLCICFCLIGASLFFPVNSRKAYFLLPPLAIYVTKILWLCTVETNEEYNSFFTIAPFYFFLTGAIIALILIFTFNWIMTLHFHKREGIRARIDGTIDLNELDLIDDAEAMKILRGQRKAFKEVQANDGEGPMMGISF